MCCTRNRTNSPLLTPFRQTAETLPFTQVQLHILSSRYENVLLEYKKRAFLYAIIFHGLRSIMTIGSLIVPALLSINFGSTTSPTLSEMMYWITWSLSLFVTTSNGILTLFKVDKKYYMIHTVYEQLQSEGWQYLELTGKYSGFYTPNQKPTHENQFRYFCHAVEKIKMKQVEEEYFKVQETGHTHPHNGQQAQEQKSLIPPTPATEILQQFLTKQKGNGSGISANIAIAPRIEESTEFETSSETESEQTASNTKKQTEKSPSNTRARAAEPASASRRDSGLSSIAPLYQGDATELSERTTLSV